ncbi:hypothetical protein AArcSl_0820 [Halalkaliarchaeum desulfuricum]|uniref:Uncharacterized protein n=1 Tax=Halalkaliarchaeum desulfuricum TaxID=2055893 RepID=A0A343TH92_9EURY|nr:hypothetical protein AArcSl_0820 [Halalkaliarchaeum desulfuricum]
MIPENCRRGRTPGTQSGRSAFRDAIVRANDRTPGTTGRSGRTSRRRLPDVRGTPAPMNMAFFVFTLSVADLIKI